MSGKPDELTLVTDKGKQLHKELLAPSNDPSNVLLAGQCQTRIWHPLA
ncbi:hypothetical protein C4J86_4095 [Pseudomonas sp. R2-7-07]|nr:hypothetical protein C4J86_4095 [Pseudomonas sp. R2-7-07]